MRTGGVLRTILDKPALRPFFYEGKALPAAPDELRWQVLTVGEMLGDVLEVGLYHTREIQATGAYEDWFDYASFVMRQSPALNHLVREHPGWYPKLVPLLAGDEDVEPERAEAR
ncbi:hypothetical protein AMIS_49870 [Actinoplanes missouriensis 431]|uniref:Uncharacterized protein n=1 Tax=Actinoplanes missouriensis (strain ATCC 14538 / DSM 43046 / CBS 188.64 / JCM 3121 / NBRC 102363 / NCIMB 12654 / NRRL B-3342 / UNCC 431) TaxID=512565 RepID=I0HB20_ACTM4|nr:hypothetical protein AMIS_49870 [Actinoplanes missouriensis 431]